MPDKEIHCKNQHTCALVARGREKHEQLEGTIKTQIEQIIASLGKTNESLSSELKNVTNTDDLQGLVTHLVGVLVQQVENNQSLISESSKIIQSLEEESEKLRRDNLTGLYNRHRFDDYYNRLVQNGVVFSLGVIDIDKFKNLNDTYGHLCGDEVLKFLAKKLRELFGDEFVFRFGGEEFIILYEGPKGKLQRVLENFLATIKNIRLEYKKQHKFNVSFTGGVSEYKAGTSFEELFRTADSLLYIGKQNGRGKIIE